MSRVLIMAGGTGGHIFPALAVAENLRACGCNVSWLGSRGGMEQPLVTRAGFDANWLSISGVRGKGLLTRLLSPFKVTWSVLQSITVILRRKPQVVLGMGGFASGPGGLAAWLMRKPLVIHEQNAVAGTTNRILSRFATRIFEAFPGSFPQSVETTVAGNPVRQDILALPLPSERDAQHRDSVRILVLGGSQGALVLNQYVPAELSGLAKEHNIEVRHQAGRKTLDIAEQSYREHAAGLEVSVEAFIEDMAQAYLWADLVICRAGALTISELAAAGVAAILVPFPHAIDDHQAANARHLEKLGAAQILPQSECQRGVLQALLSPLVSSADRMQTMGEAARQLARPKATATVSNACLELAAGGAHD